MAHILEGQEGKHEEHCGGGQAKGQGCRCSAPERGPGRGRGVGVGVGGARAGQQPAHLVGGVHRGKQQACGKEGERRLA